MPDDRNLERVPADRAGQGEGSSARLSLAALGTGFLTVAAMVLVLAWAGPSDGGEEPGSGAGASVAVSSAPTESAATPVSRTVANTRLTRCVEAVRMLQGPLDAARPALDRWAVHVDAMDRLVAGEITHRQAVRSWKRSRQGVQRKVEAFRRAETALRQGHGVDCPRPDLLAPGSRALPACARRVALEVRVLRTARESIELWEHHVHQMDRLRLGELAPQRASRLWLRMWRRGQRDLADYREAVRRTRQEAGCDAGAPTP
jgi:hypothetical protein